ncbi:hypothetical protein [Embleya sp. NPDC005575]
MTVLILGVTSADSPALTGITNILDDTDTESPNGRTVVLFRH